MLRGLMPLVTQILSFFGNSLKCYGTMLLTHLCIEYSIAETMHKPYSLEQNIRKLAGGEYLGVKGAATCPVLVVALCRQPYFRLLNLNTDVSKDK